MFFGVVIFPVVAKNTQDVKEASVESKQVEILKKKIATKVAETLKEEKEVVSGFVKSVKDNVIVIDDDLVQVKYSAKIDPDLTFFGVIKGSSIEKGDKDEVKKGDFLIVQGVRVGKEIITNNVYKDVPFMVESGNIVGIKGKTLKVETLDKETMTVEVTSRTKGFLLNTDTLKKVKTRLSKVKEGDMINFVYKITKKSDQKEEAPKMVTLYRYLIIPQEYFEK